MTVESHLGLHDYFHYFFLSVSSGSVTINADSSVQIMAEEAFPLDQLDVQVGCYTEKSPGLGSTCTVDSGCMLSACAYDSKR